jgi:type III secretory pathway lipoprotein EscJ
VEHYAPRYLMSHVNQRVSEAIPERTKRKEGESRALNETLARIDGISVNESAISLCERPCEGFRNSAVSLSSREIRIVFD